MSKRRCGERIGDRNGPLNTICCCTQLCKNVTNPLNEVRYGTQRSQNILSRKIDDQEKVENNVLSQGVFCQRTSTERSKKKSLCLARPDDCQANLFSSKRNVRFCARCVRPNNSPSPEAHECVCKDPNHKRNPQEYLGATQRHRMCFEPPAITCRCCCRCFWYLNPNSPLKSCCWLQEQSRSKWNCFDGPSCRSEYQNDSCIRDRFGCRCKFGPEEDELPALRPSRKFPGDAQKTKLQSKPNERTRLEIEDTKTHKQGTPDPDLGPKTVRVPVSTSRGGRKPLVKPRNSKKLRPKAKRSGARLGTNFVGEVPILVQCPIVDEGEVLENGKNLDEVQISGEDYILGNGSTSDIDLILEGTIGDKCPISDEDHCLENGQTSKADQILEEAPIAEEVQILEEDSFLYDVQDLGHEPILNEDKKLTEEGILNEDNMLEEELVADDGQTKSKETLSDDVEILRIESILNEIQILEEPVPDAVPILEEPIPDEVPILEEPVPDEVPTLEESVPDEASILEEPVPDEAPILEEPVPVKHPILEEPVPDEVPTLEEPVPNEVPTLEESVPDEVPTLEEPVPDEVPTLGEPVSDEAPIFEEPVPDEAPIFEEPVPDEVPYLEDPVPDEGPVLEEPVSDEVPILEESVPDEVPILEEPVPNDGQILKRDSFLDQYQISEDDRISDEDQILAKARISSEDNIIEEGPISDDQILREDRISGEYQILEEEISNDGQTLVQALDSSDDQSLERLVSNEEHIFQEKRISSESQVSEKALVSDDSQTGWMDKHADIAVHGAMSNETRAKYCQDFGPDFRCEYTFNKAAMSPVNFGISGEQLPNTVRIENDSCPVLGPEYTCVRADTNGEKSLREDVPIPCDNRQICPELCPNYQHSQASIAFPTVCCETCAQRSNIKNIPYLGHRLIRSNRVNVQQGDQYIHGTFEGHIQNASTRILHKRFPCPVLDSRYQCEVATVVGNEKRQEIIYDGYGTPIAQGIRHTCNDNNRPSVRPATQRRQNDANIPNMSYTQASATTDCPVLGNNFFCKQIGPWCITSEGEIDDRPLSPSHYFNLNPEYLPDSMKRGSGNEYASRRQTPARTEPTTPNTVGVHHHKTTQCLILGSGFHCVGGVYPVPPHPAPTSTTGCVCRSDSQNPNESHGAQVETERSSKAAGEDNICNETNDNSGTGECGNGAENEVPHSQHKNFGTSTPYNPYFMFMVPFEHSPISAHGRVQDFVFACEESVPLSFTTSSKLQMNAGETIVKPCFVLRPFSRVVGPVFKDLAVQTSYTNISSGSFISSSSPKKESDVIEIPSRQRLKSEGNLGTVTDESIKVV